MDEALLPKAFAVRSVPKDFDPSIPPSSGEEYLQHVMYEASNCPQVVVAHLDRAKFKKVDNSILNNNIHQSESKKFAPSIEWQHLQVSKFSKLRQRISKIRKFQQFEPVPLPKANEEEKWYEIFFGENEEKLSPYLSVLLSMNEPLLSRVLEYHVEWLEDGLKPDQGRWIYAILSCISCPLSSNDCSSLRDLARTCAKLRSQGFESELFNVEAEGETLPWTQVRSAAAESSHSEPKFFSYFF